MKSFFVLLSFVVVMTKVNCETSSAIDLKKLLISLEVLQNQNPEYENESKFLIEQIKSAIALESNAISFAKSSMSIRTKRQTTSINCAALEIQLNFTQNQVKTIQRHINEANTFLDNSNSNKEFYEKNVLNKTASETQKMIWQSFLNFLQSSITSTKLSLQSLQRTLALLEKAEMKLRTDLEAYCAFTTPSPTTASCGTFMPFDSNDGVSSKGMAGGVNQDGSIAYVGFGNGANCSNQLQAPCALTTSGCKIPCGASEILDSKSFYYLLSNSNLEWVGTSSSLVSSIGNTLKIVGPHNFMFGRAFINDRYVLGKIQSSNGVYSFQAVTSSGAVSLTSGFEVLRCKIPGEFCSNSGSSNSMSLGSSLSANQTLASSDGCSLKLTNSDLVLTDAIGNVVWRAGINNGQTLLNFDGSVAVLDAKGKIVWSIQGPSGSTLSIENCQVRLVNEGKVVWNTSNDYSTSSSAPFYSCGRMFDLRSNDPNSPLSPGFISGTFMLDGSPIFPGSGVFPACGGEVPTSVLSSSPIYKRGAHYSCGNNSMLSLDNLNARYYGDHSHLHWVSVDSVSAAINTRGVLSIKNSQNLLYITRFNYNYNNNDYLTIGHIFSNRSDFIYWNGNEKISTTDISNFEVLVCDSSLPAKTTPSIVISKTSLTPGNSLLVGENLSSNGGSYLSLNGGDLILYARKGYILWRAAISGGFKVINNGQTVSVEDKDEKVLWLIKGPFVGSVLTTQNDEVVLTSLGSVVWSSSKGYAATNFTPEYACGTMLDLRSNDPNSPWSPGLISGNFYDGSPIFPGTGYYPGEPCYGDITTFILESSPIYKRGAHYPCPNVTILSRDGVNARYYADHPHLRWVPGEVSYQLLTPGVLKIQNDKHTYYIRRLNVTKDNMTYVMIGFLGTAAWTMNWNGNRLEYHYSYVPSEFLVCNSTLPPKEIATVPINRTSLEPGNFMLAGETLATDSGSYLKIYGGDLILYATKGHILWRAAISGGIKVVNNGGAISVEDSNGKILWLIKGPTGSILTTQNNAVVLLNGEKVFWSTAGGYRN